MFIKFIPISLLIIILYFVSNQNISLNFTNNLHTESNIIRSKINAFIISADCHSLRYNTTKENIERVFPKFFTILCFPVIPLNDSRIHTSNVLLLKKYSSNLLAFIDLWTTEIPKYSKDDDYQWSFVFEDDVNFCDPSIFTLSNYITPLEELMRNSEVREKDGFFYLGICAPKFIGETIFMGENKNLSSQRGFGFCLHATGITVKRSRSFWGEIASYRPNSPDLPLDSQLVRYCSRSQHHYYTLGSNFQYPPDTRHYGIAYQDRRRFSTTI